jgi:hypothetical protein
MRHKPCEPVRRELEELTLPLTLNEDFSAATAEHLQTCFECRDFQRQQTKLRQIVGSLGTVDAPADFDFRLRARLAADSQAPSFRFWSFTVKGLATAAVLVVFGVGALVVWQSAVHEKQPPVVAEAPRQVEEPNRRIEPGYHDAQAFSVNTLDVTHGTTPAVADNTKPPRRIQRSPVLCAPKRTVSTMEFSSERANVVSNTTAASSNATVFPIETSLQSVKVSLDDGLGNAHTISFPTVSFGSQRVLTTPANQFAPKGAW